MADTTLNVVIRGDASGATAATRTVRRDLDDVKTGALSAGNAVDQLKSTIAGLTGAAALTALVKSSLDAALQMERLQKMFTAASGSAALAAKEMEYVRGVVNRMGLDLVTTADSYGKFLAAIRGTTLEGEKGRKVFESVSNASAALGLRADETSGIFNALQQMMSKGKVQAEELRGQLGERLPGAFKLVADAMGMTTAELDKALKDGKVLADDLLPKLADQLDKKFGGSALSAQNQINLMNNALFEAKGAFGAALIPAFTDAVKSITPAIGKLKEFIGGLQILSIKMFAFADKTKAWVDAGGLLGMLSGKNRASFSSSITQINANAESTIADLMKRYTPSGSDYSAAEKLRQAGNKTTKLPTDNKGAAEAAKALKLAEQYEKDYLADMEKWRKAQEQLADTYDKAAIAAAEQRRDRELAILKNQYDQGLLSQSDYLDKQYQQQVAASDKQLAQLEAALIRNTQAYFDALAAEPPKPTDGNAVAVEAYNKAIILTAQLLKESEEAAAKFNAAAAKAATAAIANEGAKAAVQRENAKAALGFEAQLLQAAGETYAATLKQIEADKIGRKPIDAKTDALRDQLDAVKALKAAQDETNRINAIKDSTTDINISMMNDPYAEQRAAVEERYRREAELIQQNIDLKIAAGTLEMQEYEALSAKLLAMAQKRDKDIADSQRNQGTDGWNEAVKAAQRAFPKLVGIDKALYAVRQDYTVKNIDGTRNETKSNLSMYAGYAEGAAALMGGIASTMDTTSRSGFETAKALNIGMAVMSTAAGVMNAFRDVPYPANIAVAATTAALGAAQIAMIAATSFGGAAQAPQAPAMGTFTGGSALTGGTVGASIGNQYTSVGESQDQESLQRIAASMENASLALGRVADGLTKVGDLFGDDTFMSKAIESIAYASTTYSYASTTDRSIMHTAQLDMTAGDVATRVMEYFESKRKAGWYNYATTWTVGGGIEELFQQSLDRVASQIMRGAAVMSTTANLSEADIDAREIKLVGRKPDDIAADLEKWFADASGAMAMTVDGLIDFTFYGENAFDALMRLSTALQSANEAFELIGATLIDDTMAGGNAAYKLQQLMGGTEAFTESIDSYFTTMFSDAEQDAARAAQANRQVNTAFAEINTVMTASIPKTREEFRSLVNSITSDIKKYTHLAATVADAQLSSEYQKQADSAASTFAALMKISEAFGTVMESADAAAEAAKELADQRTQLEIEIMKLTGRELEATAIERQIELDAMDSSLRPLQERIYALQDEAEAAEKAAEAARALATAQSKFNTNFSQELNGYSASSVQGIKDQITEVFTDAVNALDDGLIQYDVQGIKDQITQTFTSVWSAAAPDIQQQLTAILQVMPTSWSSGNAVRDWYNSIRNSVGDNLKPAIESVSALVAQLASDMDGVARDSGIARLQDQLRGIAVDMPASFADGSAVRQWYANLVTNAEAALKPTLMSVQDLVVQLATAIDTDIANAAKVTPVDNSAAEYAAKVAEQQRQMEIQIMELSGDAAGASAATRAIELASLDATLHPLQQRIWQLTDEAAATAKAAELANQRSSLEIQIMDLEGKSRDAIQAQRIIDIRAMDASLRPLQLRVWALQDETEALEKANAIAATRREMELTIMELEGRTAEATTLRRADELAALDASLRPLQQRIWQLEDEKTAAEGAADAISKLNDALKTAETDLRNAFSAEKDRLTEAYQAELEALNTRLDSAKTVVADLTDSLNMLTSARKAMRLEDEAYQRNQYLIARQQLSTVLDQAAGGDLSGVKNMGESLDILTSQGQEAYANSTDYQRDFYIVTDSIEKLEGYTKKALTPAEEAVTELERQSRQLTDNHNAQIRAMDSQLNALLGIDTTAKTIAQALSAYNAAKAAADAAAKASATSTATSAAAQRYGIYHTVGGATIFHQDGTSNYLAGDDAYDRLTSIFSSAPRFALGGITSGISIAGEAGPEAVVPLPDGRRIPVQMTGAADNRELVEEIKALNARIDRLTAATGEVSKATQKTAKLIDQWDGDGMPEVRAA